MWEMRGERGAVAVGGDTQEASQGREAKNFYFASEK